MNTTHLVKKPLTEITCEDYHQMMTVLTRMSTSNELACTCGDKSDIEEGESIDCTIIQLGNPMVSIILSIAYYVNGDGRDKRNFSVEHNVERCAPVRTVIEIIDELVRVGAISVTRLMPPKG